ncbi:MAG: hypothetical protein IJH63_00445 [Methanobrevibacter sp.]|nr:hypothetical protein [Methanosphaera sp.]MBR0369172.1 hypothetical protein [Methanobrevibacter sp.]
MAVSNQTLYEHLRTLNKQWFYDKTELDTALEAKADNVEIPTKTSDLTNDSNFISTSNTAGLIKNDGTIDTNAYLTEHQDISGKANSADLATVATSGSYNDLEDVPQTFTPADHTQASSTITDTATYSNIGNVATTQASINAAIDTKLGALLSVELIEVAVSLPTAAASTMNKFYLVAESTSATNDNYEIYVTVRTGSSGSYEYDWEKVDTARIDLSGKADVSHTHGNLTNDGKIGSNADYFVTTTTGGAVTSQASIGNISTSGAIGSTSGKVITTTTNGVLTASDWTDELDGVIQNLISYGQSQQS